MSREVYTVALKHALMGIKDSCKDVNWSLVLMNNGTVVTSDEETIDPAVKNAAHSFQDLLEKSAPFGGLDNLLINGEKGKVYVSCFNDMHIFTRLNKHADLPFFRTISRAIIPTILKVLDSIGYTVTPTPLKSKKFSPPTLSKPTQPEPIPSRPEAKEENLDERETEATKETKTAKSKARPKSPVGADAVPSQQLIVDKYKGLMVRTDTAQIDLEVLRRWTSVLDIKEINEVNVETFNGRTARFKVKLINDSKLQGRGLIRIPEKTSQALGIKRGELVRVKPVLPNK